MAARSKARKRALDVLYAAEVRDAPVLELLAEQITLDSPPVPSYGAFLVRGVVSHRERIDSLLASYAEGWTLDRMPPVDRNILRIGVYELLWAPDVPDGVVLSEAVELATDLSTDASPAFVNGLLARLAQLKPTLTLDEEAAPEAAEAAEAVEAGSRPSRKRPPSPSSPSDLPAIAPHSMLEKCFMLRKAPDLAPFLTEGTFSTWEPVFSRPSSCLRNSSHTDLHCVL